MPDLITVTRYGFVNAYLVTEDDGLTVIDTMIPGSAKTILAAAEKQSLPIRRIVLTHAHGDHIGSLDALAEQLPDAEVIIGEREARLLAKDTTMEPGEPDAKLRGGYPGARTKPSRTVTEGERIGSLEVIATPGHTPGHLAFVDLRDRTVYAGDTFATLGGMATTARANPLFPLPAMATWHRPSVVESARRLRALEPARLAPGHGRIVESPAAAMDAAIARAA